MNLDEIINLDLLCLGSIYGIDKGDGVDYRNLIAEVVATYFGWEWEKETFADFPFIWVNNKLRLVICSDCVKIIDPQYESRVVVYYNITMRVMDIIHLLTDYLVKNEILSSLSLLCNPGEPK